MKRSVRDGAQKIIQASDALRALPSACPADVADARSDPFPGIIAAFRATTPRCPILRATD